MLFVSKKVKEALLFYACAETYKRRGIHPQGSPVRYAPAPIVHDHGGRARAALEELQRRGLAARIRRFFHTPRAAGNPTEVAAVPINPQPSLGLIPAELADTNEA